MYPKVRFRGFDEPWKKVKLGDVAEIIGGGTPSTSNLEYWDGNINWFTPTEVGKTIYLHESQRKLSELGLKKSSARLLNPGAILFTSRAGIGNTGIIINPSATNQGFQSIQPNKNIIDSYFIFCLSSRLKRYALKHSAGSTFTEISGSEMKKAKIRICAKNEQNKISTCIKSLDSLLSLQQRKLELMKQLYRYLLENLNTEKKHPNIFIKGNYSHWNKVKLSDLGEIRTGKTPTPSVRSNYTNIGMPFVTPTEIVDLYNYNTSRFISNSGLKKAQIAPKGSILVTCIASIGKNTCVFKEKVAFNQQINAVTPNSFNDSTFLAFKSLQWSKRIDCLTANTAMQIINKKDFSNIETMVPNLNEQKDISKIWLKSYSLTYKYSDAKKLIIRLKKFLLQNLFI
ncbi:restriction endonuclease subunit S [Lactobacillus mulieris]|uniref:restriction endonuclease subunit S n=1 Tax=Lactobacillus mulieris TaxID=2508708 RepID=UPI0022863211|nr:restriction endonuclease subunit S [Lactobacillus mulieris]